MKSMDTIFSILILSLKINIPIADSTTIPVADHTAYATLISIFFSEMDKQVKHIIYPKNVPTVGNIFVKPLDIFIKVVATYVIIFQILL